MTPHAFARPSRASLIAGALLVLLLLVSVLVVAPRARASASHYSWASKTDLVADDVGRVDWSPDGVWIYYDSSSQETGDGETQDLFDIRRIKPDGTGDECLTCGHTEPKLQGDVQIGNPSLDPSGRWMVFQVEKKVHTYNTLHSVADPGSGSYNDLWVMDMNTAAPRAVYQLTDVRDGDRDGDGNVAEDEIDCGAEDWPTWWAPGGQPIEVAGGSLHPQFSHEGLQLMWADFEGSIATVSDPNSCPDGISVLEVMGNWRVLETSFAPAGTTTCMAPRLTTPCLKDNPTAYDPGANTTAFRETSSWSEDDKSIYMAGNTETGHDEVNMDVLQMPRANPAGYTRLTQTSGTGSPAEASHWDEFGHVNPCYGDALAFMSTKDSSVTEPGDTTIGEIFEWLETDLWLQDLTPGAAPVRITRYNESGSSHYNANGAVVRDNDWSPDGSKIAIAVTNNAASGPPTNELDIINLSHSNAKGSPNVTCRKSPTSTVSAGGMWVLPQNAYVDDGAYETYVNWTVATGENDAQRYYGFGLQPGLPSSPDIKDIDVYIHWRVDTLTNTPRIRTRLTWNGGTSWTPIVDASTTSTVGTVDKLTFTEAMHDFTYAQLSDSNFRVQVLSDCVTACPTHNFGIDWISVRVRYT